MTVQEKAHDLFKDQLSSWPLLGANWEKLGQAQVKEFDFDGFSIRVQCNPKRIVSSAARVDKASIEKRPCFLCSENRPPEGRKRATFFGDRERQGALFDVRRLSGVSPDLPTRGVRSPGATDTAEAHLEFRREESSTISSAHRGLSSPGSRPAL